jgi:hypothetical protein
MVCITGDTTEADLKQRREISRGSVVYVDQPPVRAAVTGALLVLEGLERAERNVLPLLNNLLENREMALEDGRFLCSPMRWDALVAAGMSPEQLTQQGLIRVHPDFRVCAIALPVPPYAGRALDPPLRSRFSARYIPLEDISDAAADAASTDALSSALIAAVLALRQAGGVGGSEAVGESLRISDRLTSSAAPAPQVSLPALKAALYQLRCLSGLDPDVLPGLLHRCLPFWFIPEFTREPSSSTNATQGHFDGLCGALRSIVSAMTATSRSTLSALPRAFEMRSACSIAGTERVGLVEMAPQRPPSAPSATTTVTEWKPLRVQLGGRVSSASERHWSWVAGETASGYCSTAPSEALLAAMVCSHAAGRDVILVGSPGM